jgi:hypothetical protein
LVKEFSATTGTGQRLWTLQPEHRGDFNVPTPIVRGNHLWLTTENNGTRRYQFDETGKISPKPISANFDLASDTHTPVLAGSRISLMHESVVLLLDTQL